MAFRVTKQLTVLMITTKSNARPLLVPASCYTICLHYSHCTQWVPRALFTRCAAASAGALCQNNHFVEFLLSFHLLLSKMMKQCRKCNAQLQHEHSACVRHGLAAAQLVHAELKSTRLYFIQKTRVE